MTSTTRLMSADDLLNMPSDDMRHELVRGELQTMAPASFGHGAIITNISTIVDRHVKENRLGVVVGAETGFVLRRDPDTVRAPDLGFVAMHRIPAGELPMKYWEGAPDLAMEVVSPSETLQEAEDKVDDYLTAGTQMVLIVNPKRRTITVHRPNLNPVVFRESDTVDTSPVISGLSFAVREAFV